MRGLTFVLVTCRATSTATQQKWTTTACGRRRIAAIPSTVRTLDPKAGHVQLVALVGATADVVVATTVFGVESVARVRRKQLKHHHFQGECDSVVPTVQTAVTAVEPDLGGQLRLV